MAYVAITNELINRVEGMIRAMRNNEVNATCPQLNKDYQLDASHIYNLSVWGPEHLHLLADIPKDWMARQDTAYINVIGDHNVDGSEGVPTKAINKQVRFSGMASAYARPSKDYWNRTSGEIHIDAVRALPDFTPGRTECIERFMDACTEAEIDAKWEKVRSDITGLLRKCKSLNEALKLLPTLRMYIPKEDIQRVERKIERAPREALVVEIDTDGITAAAVAARLMGAAHGITGEQT